jgi:S1-C subfamily serine protease
MLSRMQLVACIFVPLLVLVGAYGLVRVSLPGAGDVETADDDFSEEERIGQITDAFRLYAQAFENRFPEVDRLYGDELMAAVRENLKIPPYAGRSTAFGFGRLTFLQRNDPTFGYHGSGAKLGDAKRVLVHWSTADGMSQVIFCDLCHRKVEHRELWSLLSPWQTLANQCVVRVGSGGSGTVITANGLIVTADHVLPSKCSSVDIRFADGRVIASKVESRSKRFDVAVLKIPVDQPIPFIRLAERRVANDEPAAVIGFVGGRTEPLIRNVRTVQYVLDELITTWNKVGGGDSGGAVLDAKGCLIGVLLGPADPYPRTCRTISSLTLLKAFPVLTEKANPK